MISAACGLLGAPDQSLIHRSTSKPASSMSKESCSRDGNAICDWEEWSGPSAMIQIISPIASSLVTPRWRKPDSNHRYRVARSRFPEVTIGSARPCLLPFRGYAAGNLRPVLLVQSRPTSPVMLVHLFETREEAETWMAAW